MDAEITPHARERMRKYNVSEEMVQLALDNPTSIMEGYIGRKVYQRRLNGYVLRVILEESKELRKRRVITVYKAKSERYEV